MEWSRILHHFKEDYSHYGYLYLIHEKSQSLDLFKIYKDEVENQLNRKIKVVRSDRGSEYYDRYDGSSNYPGPFVNFLKSVILSLSTPCQRHLIRIVLLKEETA